MPEEILLQSVNYLTIILRLLDLTEVHSLGLLRFFEDLGRRVRLDNGLSPLDNIPILITPLSKFIHSSLVHFVHIHLIEVNDKNDIVPETC
jgi:hypothetical protein